MAKKKKARRPSAAADQDKLFGGGTKTDDAPSKTSPDWPFYSDTAKFEKKVNAELAMREDEPLPKGITMRQTEARHKRIHLLQLTMKKLEKIRKMWDGDPTPDLPITE